MRAVRFKVSGDLLREVMRMPATARIIAASMDPDGHNYPDTVVFVVVDDSIPDADRPHDTDPTVTSCYDDYGRPTSWTWDWNVKT